jgi:ATP-dependent exoDNAse (exonuclease V) beta subunit
MLKPILSEMNKHARDANLLFDDSTHKYTIVVDPDSKYTSVTTWLHAHFEQFDADAIIAKMMKSKNWNSMNKYYGLTVQQIKDQWTQNGKDACELGTKMHYQIECFMNQEIFVPEYTHENLLKNAFNIDDNSEEYNFFLDYVKASPNFKPYRTEWTVYDEDVKIAGSIDMVYENLDGTLSIYDWKRAKDITKSNPYKKFATTKEISHLPDTNFWHYSLQLNMYKAILERKYGKIVKDMFLVRLHPDNSKKTFELIKCVNLSQEITDLFEKRKGEINI